MMDNARRVAIVLALAWGVGRVAAGAQGGKMDIDELKAQLDAGAMMLLIDVREDHEIASGSIPGAVHIPVGDLEARMTDIPKDVRLVFF